MKVDALIHFYGLHSFPIRWWHPIDLLCYLLCRTIFRGDPVHCNIEIDELFYDFSVFHGAQTLKRYYAEPVKTIQIECCYENMKVLIAQTNVKRRHRAMPLILDAIGIWPKWLKRPLNCVVLCAMMIGHGSRCRRPVHLLRSLTNGKSETAAPTTATATGHVGARRDEGAQETGEGEA